MKNLFIDSNIWLSLYSYTNDDLEKFGKLRELIGNEIKLWIPTQVRDEVMRNRESKIFSAFNSDSFSIPNLTYPVFCKEYPQYNDFYKKHQELVKEFDEWKKALIEDIKNENLPADKTIGMFFEKDKLIDSNPYIEKAFSRFNLGNPPGKKGSYGDAVNWECLLDCIEEGEDLFFISMDKDFSSTGFKDSFHPFLLKEWKTKKKSNIYFYKALNPFLEDHFKSIKLESENKKAELINGLRNSINFSTTHALIQTLSNFSEWTNEEIEDLCSIEEENTQIGWILGDPDVYDFYTVLVSKYLPQDDNENSVNKVKKHLYELSDDYEEVEYD